MADGRFETSRCFSSSSYISVFFCGSNRANMSARRDSAVLSKLYFLVRFANSLSAFCFPMKVPSSISRILTTRSPAGSRASSNFSHNFKRSPSKVSCLFFMISFSR